MTIKKRTYNSDARREQAELTKQRILTAAKKLFNKKGFQKVKIEDIAEAADVSAPSIYSLYKSKLGVLRALLDQSLPVDLMQENKQAASAQERMIIASKIVKRLYDGEREQMQLLQSAAILAPEFKKLEKEREERRYKRQEETVKLMMKEGAFAKGMTLAKARDILWAFTGRDMYRMFVVERGWSSDRYQKWLAQTLMQTLLDE